MDDYEDDEPALEEQIFHNNVREQIVSIKYTVNYYRHVIIIIDHLLYMYYNIPFKFIYIMWGRYRMSYFYNVLR